jgi:Phosphotransferase system cellobiose-specific component IIB
MKKILLACAGGYSTSMLVSRMQDAAKKKGIEVEIDAVATSRIAQEIENISVIMLGPQMGHNEDKFRKEYGHRVPVATINMVDYGMMDGEKVLTTTLKLIEGFAGGQ